ncbi:MAG: hypothetical protein AAF337_04290 [Pseudomonadota bacterium]
MMRFCVLAGLLALAACSSETQAEGDAAAAAFDGFTINVSAEGDPSVCSPKTVTTIAGEKELYMVKGDKTLAHKDGGQRTSFPLQLQFRGFGPGTVGKDTSISMSNYDMACSDMVMTWKVEECVSQSRDTVPCPAFKIVGGDLLADFVITQ